MVREPDCPSLYAAAEPGWPPRQLGGGQAAAVTSPCGFSLMRILILLCWVLGTWSTQVHYQPDKDIAKDLAYKPLSLLG